MNPFFAYLIKSTISLAVLYLLFRLAMHNDKTHSLNRFLLLAILFVSAVLPLTNFQFFYEEVQLKQIEVFREFVSAPVFTPDIANLDNSEIPQILQSESRISIHPYFIIYISIILVLLLRLLVSVARVLQIIRKAEKRKFSTVVLAIVQDLIQPFTFFNKIILSEKDFTENKDIVVAHEHEHIKQMHAIDLVVCELFTMVHFFNPFMWLLRRDLKLVHEYQADQAVLNKGIDTKKYQLLVLQKSVGERRFAMANHFTQKPILKRIKMMHKKNKKQWTWVKIIVFVPALILLLQAFARPEFITKADEIFPVAIQEDLNAKWLERWTIENLGNGFFQPEINNIDAPRKPNNVLVVLMNRRNELLIENQYAKKEDVKRIVKEFLIGKNPDGKKGPDYIETEISLVGKVKTSQGFISFRNDLETSKDEMNRVLKSIGEACLEARNEKAQILFGGDYFFLDEQKREAVNMAVPIWFSIERPKIVKTPPPPPPIYILLDKDGVIYLGPKKSMSTYSFDEFVGKLAEIEEGIKKFNEQHNVNYPVKCKVTMKEGVEQTQYKKLKELLETRKWISVFYFENS